MIEIVKPGLQTTVQDLGRPGYLSMAMPPAGAMDQFSHIIANRLVGNPGEFATLETTLIGPTIDLHTDTTLAVTGASVEVFVDDELRPSWTSIRVRKGQRIRLGSYRAGMWAYIAFSGGVDVPTVMSSRSTYALTRTGGHDGRALKAGDRVGIGGGLSGEAGLELPERARPALSDCAQIRLVYGLAAYRFTCRSLRDFADSEYLLSPESNRTGYRFKGASLEFNPRTPPFGAGSNPSNVVSFGYPLGSVQVPNGEEPICLLRDAVTGGGFATLGTVITADLDRLAQVQPNRSVRFIPVSIEDALRCRRDYKRATDSAIESITRI